MKTGEVIKRIMRERGVSQSDICRLCNVQNSLVSDLLNGRRGSFSLETLKRLSVGLNVSCDELIFGNKTWDDLSYINTVRKFEEAGFSKEWMLELLELLRRR